MKNKAAVALGKLRRGVKEKISEAKRIACRRNLELARAKRSAMAMEQAAKNEKRCPKCNTIKPASEFWISREGKILTYCKACGSKKFRTEAGKIKWREAMRRHRRKNPEKERARKAITDRVNSGSLVRPSSCERCLKISKVHAHHADYSKPLEVKWLCQACHVEEHRKLAA